MHYTDVIPSLSATIYDVVYCNGKITIIKSTPKGWLVETEEEFYGTYDEGIYRGNEIIQDIVKRNQEKKKK